MGRGCRGSTGRAHICWGKKLCVTSLPSEDTGLTIITAPEARWPPRTCVPFGSRPAPAPDIDRAGRRACSCSAARSRSTSLIHPAAHSLRARAGCGGAPALAGTLCGNLFMAMCVRAWGRGGEGGALLLERDSCQSHPQLLQAWLRIAWVGHCPRHFSIISLNAQGSLAR